MTVVSWERYPGADSSSRRGYRWTSHHPPAQGVVTVPLAWSHQVDTITAEVTAAATEQLGGAVAVHQAVDLAEEAAAERVAQLAYLEHPQHVRDRFWVDVHAGHQAKLTIWRGEHHLGGVEYVLATSGRRTLHRVDCPTMRDRVHGTDLMNRIRRLREAAELGKPVAIEPAHLDELDVDATLAWIWRGPRPHLLTAADAAWMPPPPTTCRTCVPTYHLPGEQPPLPAAAVFDERHLGREFTTGEGAELGTLAAITRRTSRTDGGVRVETILEFTTGHHVTLDADGDDIQMTGSAADASSGVN